MKKNKLFVLAAIFLLISFIFIFASVSYSIFTYLGQGATNNVINTGKVIFSYSDSQGGGNGILIENAYPLSDEKGCVLSAENEYFDFNVSAVTTTSTLAYEITVLKDENSTLDEDFVKIYLTTLDGGIEKSTPLTMNNQQILTYNELKDTDHNLLQGKTIYNGIINKGDQIYQQNFRLRMWLKTPENSVDNMDWNRKSFSVKVNVSAISTY